jgi:acyl carrier protein
MIDDTLDERLREVSAAVLGIDDDGLSDASSPDTIPEWTSLRHLSLIAAVEEAFAIQFSLDEINSSHKYGELRRLVAARLGQRR